MDIFGINIVDIVIVAVIAVSVIYGLHRGFISGVLSLAALIGSTALAFQCSGTLAAYLKGNETLTRTLMYYMDAGSRIGDLDVAMLTASQVTSSNIQAILTSARLPEAFESAFIGAVSGAAGGMTVSDLLSRTIVSVSLSIISFLICFAATYIVLTILIRMIDYVFELPVLRHMDALMGGLFGFARGVLLVIILFALVPIVLAVAPIQPIEDLIAASRLAPLFDTELILSIIRGSI